MAVAISQAGSDTFTPASNTPSRTGVAIGTAASDRLVFACIVYGFSGTASDDINSLTIGGVSATRVRRDVVTGTTLGDNEVSEIWWAAVPTGTTATFDYNLDASLGGGSIDFQCVTYAVTGADTTAPVSSSTSASRGDALTNAVSNTLTVPTDGAALGHAWGAIDLTSVSVTWTFLTENFDNDLAIAGGAAFMGQSTASRAGAATSQAITATFTAGSGSVFSPDRGLTTLAIQPSGGGGGGGGEITRIYTAADISGGSISVPSDYDASSASWHAVGGSPNATDPGSVSGGGVGGGAWARTDGLTLTPGGTVAAQIGTGDVWISTSGSAPTSTSEGVLAKGGNTNSGVTAGTGGASGSCIGTASASGGNGGAGSSGTNRAGGGGGGAGGPNGSGANGGAASTSTSTAAGGGGGGGANGGSAGSAGTSSAGGNGGNNRSGSGGGTGGATGGGGGSSGGGGAGKAGASSGTGLGSTDAIWTDNSGGPNDGTTAGPGSGGGGGRGGAVTDTTATGGQGGLYGGGGGGSGEDATSHAAGRNGVIVLVYTPTAGGGTGFPFSSPSGLATMLRR